MTETITIEADWDDDGLCLERLLLNDRPIDVNLWISHSRIMFQAQELARSIGEWQKEQNDRNLSP